MVNVFHVNIKKLNRRSKTINTIFKLNKKCNNKILLDYGFKKYRNLYIITIPLYSYGVHTVIQSRFTVSLEEDFICYDVINALYDSTYASFYDNEYSNPKENIVLKTVKNNFRKELELMKRKNIIEEIKDEEDCKIWKNKF